MVFLGKFRNWRSIPISMLCGVLALATIAALPIRADAQGISVSRNAFVKDGREWVPTGFTLVGIVAPPGHEMNDSFLKARARFGDSLLNEARALGGNTLRFQVSQPGLDPQSPIYDPNYMKEIVSRVERARQAGFAVIVSMQWEAPSGLKGATMPNDASLRAWGSLAPRFANDKGVMLELFNEPSMWETNPAAWPTWQRGMQALVDEVRELGAKNVLVLDGIHGSHVLAHAPEIQDPMGQLAYAVHPYIDNTSRSPSDWLEQWGYFARTHPVFVSEWNATSTLQCTADQPQISGQLIEFVRSRRMGLILWALDLPATLLGPGSRPITYDQFQCGTAGSGAAAKGVFYFHQLQGESR